MLRIHIYWGINSGLALVPTLAKADAGYWLEVNPVERAATGDEASVAEALRHSASRGHAVVPTPTRSESPEWVVLKPANKKRPRDFENEYRLFSIECAEADGCQVREHRRSADGRGYVPDPEPTTTLPSGSGFSDMASAIRSIAG